MDSYREPGRTVDETEIVRAKIHEAAETKRKQIEETEKTKRDRGDTPYIAWGLVSAVAIIGAAICIGTYITSKYPHPEVVNCVEKIEIISSESRVRECENGGRIETRSIDNNHIEWRCVCGPPRASSMHLDGGL